MGRLSTSSRRVVRRAKNVARRTLQRAQDSVCTSYAGHRFEAPLARLIPAGIVFAPTDADQQAVRYFLEHRFDLLGSGWVQVRYGMRCAGFEGIRFDMPASADADVNKRNEAAARVARAMLSAGYQPIDWYLDYKSGYRWSQRTWYRDIAYGDRDGVDVKVPWELSRMQHLPELAVSYSCLRDERILREFRDQLLDWIAANPPRFGVNWASTMDVGIRVANWLIAYDLLRASGADFDPEFTQVFTASVFDHARHITRNLEWSEAHRANHYLGNLGGLLMAAAYLPADRQTDAWLLFAVQELLEETERQFLADGGHFEASTSYHRLCAEIVAVCAAFICALPATRIERALAARPSDMSFGPALDPRTSRRLKANLAATDTLLSASFLERLGRAAEFTQSLTRADGSVPLIGDDDSGRFLRLGGWRQEYSVGESRTRFGNLEHFHELPDDAPYPTLSIATHQQWLAWASSMLRRPGLLNHELADDWSLPQVLAQALVKGKDPAAAVTTAATTVARENALTVDATPVEAATHSVSGSYRPGGDDLFSNARYEQFPVFGIYLVRSDRVHLVIRCGCALRDNAGVHAHEDQLAFDLVVDGRPVAVDPGTCAYTSSKRQRAVYRSSHAHYAPAANGPADRGRTGIFAAPAHAQGECIRFDSNVFIGRASVDGGTVVRTISFHPDCIEICDQYRLNAGWRPVSSDVFRPARPVAFSPGYGAWLK